MGILIAYRLVFSVAVLSEQIVVVLPIVSQASKCLTGLLSSIIFYLYKIIVIDFFLRMSTNGNKFENSQFPYLKRISKGYQQGEVLPELQPQEL